MTRAPRRQGGKAPPLSLSRLRHRVTDICADANALGDLISEIAAHARDPREALLLAARAHEIAISLVGPKLFGRVFQAKE